MAPPLLALSLHGGRALSVEPQISAGAERFELIRELGRGGMGVVYEAVDRRRRMTVALKKMRRSNAAALFKFKREFRTLTRVVHPNLVRLFELVAEDNDWFFTMELVDGLDFRSYVRPDFDRINGIASPIEIATGGASRDIAMTQTVAAPGDMQHTASSFDPLTSDSQADSDWLPHDATEPTVDSVSWLDLLDREVCCPVTDEGRLRAALSQLVEGVYALHQRGLLHRDIKPGNVLVEPAGRVVLLDFGLVTARQSPMETDFVGTPAYMAPEQFSRSYVPGPASDWYAVGVMLYEALLGTRPRSDRLERLAAVKRQCPPPSPSELGVPVPQELEELCMALLATDPVRRPNGKDIAEVLGSGRRSSARRRARITSSPTSLYGCDIQFQTLREAFERSQSGTGNTVYVHGPSGTGKTALVDAFLDAVERDAGAVVLRGRCYERESVPYKAVDSLIDALSEHLRRSPLVAQDWPVDLDALVAVFPVLRRVDSLASIAEVSEGAVDAHELRRRAFGALRDLLAALGRARPVVLFIDDLQWGDLDSAPLLDQLMRPPEAPPLLLIASYRSEEVERSPLLATLLQRGRRLGPTSAVQYVEVGALERGAANGLAQSLLPDAGPETIEAVVGESGGHPYFLRELCRSVREREGVGIAPGQVQLESVLADRINRLEEPARDVLVAAALSGKPTSADVILAASGHRGREHELLPLLEDEQLMRVATASDGAVIECFHDRVRETVSSRTAPEVARRVHRALGEAFAAADADSETLARHFHWAGDNERAAHHALQAAAQAEATYAFARAAELYRMALEGQHDAETSRLLRRTLADSLVRAGRGAEAAVIYRELADELSSDRADERAGNGAGRSGNPEAEAFELRRLAAFEYLKTGRLDQGMVEIERLLGEVGLAMPASPRRALPRLAFRRAQLRLRGTKFARRSDSSPKRERLLTLTDICWSVGVGLGMVDTFRAAYFQTRGLLFALRSGDPYRVARALCLESAILAVGSRRDRARAHRLLARAAALAKKLDRPDLDAWVLGARSFASHQSGRFRKGRDHARASLHILREQCPGLTWETNSVDFYLVWALNGLGDVRAMTARVSGLVEDANDRGDRYALANLRTGIFSAVWLAADAPDEARRGAEQAVASWTQRHGFHLQHYWAMFALAQCDLYEGHEEAAAERIRSQWTAFRRSLLLGMSALRIEAHDLRARVSLAVAARTGELAPLRQAERDSRVLEKCGGPWATGVGAVIRAGIAAVRQQRDAIQLFDTAERECRAADMETCAQAAAYRAAELRGDVHRQHQIVEEFRRQGVIEPERFIRVFAPVGAPTRSLPEG